MSNLISLKRRYTFTRLQDLTSYTSPTFNSASSTWMILPGRDVLHLFAVFICLFLARQPPQWARASSFTRFLDRTQRRSTVGRLLWTSDQLDPYLTTHNTHNRQTSMPPVRFEFTISEFVRPHTYALGRAATGTGYLQRRLRTFILKKEAIRSFEMMVNCVATTRHILKTVFFPVTHSLSFVPLTPLLPWAGSRPT